MLSTFAHPFPVTADQKMFVIVPPNQKGPKTPGWQNNPLTAAEVEERLTHNPRLNVGAVWGRPSGLIDVETDSPEAADRLRELLGEPHTLTYTSQRGRHHIYLYDDRFDGLPATVKLDGIEFRAHNCQSLIPRSETNGFRREWDNDLPPAALPESVIQRLLESAKQPVQDNFLGELETHLQQSKLQKLKHYLTRHGRRFSESVTTDGTVKLPTPCPFRPGHDDGDCCIFVNTDGSHELNCFHAKCQGKRFAELEAIDGPLDPIIVITSDTPRMVAEAIYALGHLDNVYQLDNTLVHIIHNAPKPRQCLHDNGGPKAQKIQLPYLSAVILPTAARWKRGKKRARPPKDIASAIDASPGYPGVPSLTGIVSCPILRPDGSIARTPGYDPDTGRYLDIDGEFPALMTPGKAIEILEDVISDYPFESPAHKSAMIALITTLPARPAFAGPSPFFIVDANTPGAGKGLASDEAPMIWEGRQATRFTTPREDDEMRKTLLSAALSASPYVLFDNIDRKFGGAAIEAAITAGRVSGRLLKTNTVTDIPFFPVWMGTSNNCTLSPDMIQRVCHIRLHSPMENPRTRTGFRYDNLLAHVKKHRRELAIAALSIPAGYIRAGLPDQNIKPWGSFEGWSNLVRSSLVWAGLPDCDTRETLSIRADTETELARALIESWAEVGHPMTVTAAMNHTAAHPALGEVIDELRGDKQHTLGQLLRKLNGKNIGGKMFVRSESKVPKWEVVTI